MKKYEYLSELEKRLSALPADARRDALNYYEEYFDAAGPDNEDATAVEQNLMVTLEVCYEFYLRGFHFDTINIYESQATAFKITDNGLLPPFISVRGLGETAAQDTVEKRKGKTFISVEEFSTCCSKLSKTHIEQLKALGAFAGMADTSQLTLFG